MPRLTPALIAAAVTTMILVAPLSAAADSVTTSIPTGTNSPAVIAVTPDGSKVVAVNYSNTVTVVDTATGTSTAPASLGAFSYNLVVTPSGTTALVATTGAGLSFVDTATGVATSVVYNSYIFDVALSPDGSLAYLTTASSTVIVVDVATRAEVRRITLSNAGNGYGIAVLPGGAQLLVTDISGQALLEVDAATGAVTQTIAIASNPTEVVVSADGAHVYVASFISGTVHSVNLTAGTASPIALDATGPFAEMGLTPDGSKLYVARGFGNQVTVIDTASNTTTAPIITAVISRGIAIPASGTRAYVGDSTTPGLLIVEIDRPPLLLAAAAPSAIVGTPYAFSPLIEGSPAPTFALTGTLPSGLAFDAATGRVSGTPTQSGSFSFSITATNAFGTDSQTYAVVVSATAALAATGVSPLPLAASAGLLVLLGLALRRPRRVH